MKFKNIKTGNIVRTNDKATIALMQKSDRYEAVSEKTGKKSSGKSADKTDDAKQDGGAE